MCLASQTKHLPLQTHAEELLRQRVHYHIYMPYMEGDLEDLLKSKPFSMKDRIQIFIQIAQIIHALVQQGIINPDLKPANVVYKQVNHTRVYTICDVGGLYYVNQKPLYMELDSFPRYNLIPRGKTHPTRIIGRMDHQDQTSYAYDNTQFNKHPIYWTVSTHVNPYLHVAGIKSNFDLSDATHLTNQFAVLSFLMELVGIVPPSYELTENEEVYCRTLEEYPTSKAYLDAHTKPLFVDHKWTSSLHTLIHRIWNHSSNWELVGTPKTYVHVIIQQLQRIWLSEHSTPPSQVFR